MKLNAVRTLVCAALATSGFSAYSQCHSPIYGIASDAGQGVIHKLDEYTGQSLSNSIALYDSAAIALDKASQRLYYVSVPQNNGHSYLAYYDINSGSHHQVGKTKFTYRLVSDPSQNLLWAAHDDTLFTIDPTTGYVAIYGELTGFRNEQDKNWGDLTFIGDDLYLVSKNSLYRIDTTALTVEIVNQHNLALATGAAKNQVGELIFSRQDNLGGSEFFAYDMGKSSLSYLSTSTHRFTDLASANCGSDGSDQSGGEDSYYKISAIYSLDKSPEEGDEAHIRVKFNKILDDDKDLNLKLSSGTAQKGQDFNTTAFISFNRGESYPYLVDLASPQKISVPPGGRHIDILLDLNDDGKDEDTEYFTLEAWHRDTLSDRLTLNQDILDPSSNQGDLRVNAVYSRHTDDLVEEGRTIKFRLKFNKDLVLPTLLNLELDALSATMGDDFSANANISFDRGETFVQNVDLSSRKEILVPPGGRYVDIQFESYEDDIDEGFEALKLNAWHRADQSDHEFEIIRIHDEDADLELAKDAMHSVFALDSNVEEGEFVTFRVLFNQPLNDDAKLRLRLNDGAATAQRDYNPNAEISLDGGITWPMEYDLSSKQRPLIPEGTEYVDVRVHTLRDDEVENSEDFNLAAYLISGGTDTQTTTVTISDRTENSDDFPEVSSITATPFKVSEGNSALFNVCLDGTTTQTQDYYLEVNPDTAVLADIDPVAYISFDQGITFNTQIDLSNTATVAVPQGLRCFDVKVTTANDTLDEQQEQLVIAAWGKDDGIDRKAQALIIENEVQHTAPEVAGIFLDTKQVIEGEPHLFTVVLAEATSAPAVYKLALKDDSAIQNKDYATEVNYSTDNGSTWTTTTITNELEITIPEGINQFKVKVATLADEEAEDTETYNFSVNEDTIAAQILDNPNSIPARLIENAPREYEVAEGNYAVFELSLDKQVFTTQNVFVELKSDDATANDDFDSQAEFSFDDGAFWQTIDLSAANSFLLEKDTQDFLVRVSIIKDQHADEEIETLQLHAWTQQEQLDLIEAPVLLIDATPKNAVIDFISTDKNPMMEGEEVTFNVVFDRKLEKSQSLSFNVIGLNDTTNDDFLNSGYVSLDNGVTWQEMSLVENKSVNVPAEIQNVLIKVTSLVDDRVEENEAYELSAWFEETSKHAKAVSVTDGTAPKPQVMSVIAMPDPVSEGATTTFEVTLDSKVEREISFPFQLVDGNALAQEDYDTTVEVSFDLGQSWQTVLLASTQDITLPENTDTVLVKVATLTNDEFEQSESFALVVDNVVGNVFINDDDNAEPIANPDTLEINEDEFAESIAIIANDEDPNFDPLVILGTPTSLHGVVTVNDDNSINYQPKADYNGKDIIIYSISDGRGGVATSQVTVEIAAVNDEPRQTERTLTTKEDVEITNINLLEGVTDPEGEALSIIGNPVATNGQLIDAGNGQFTYKPNENYFGDDEILFVVSDGETELNAKIAVTVTPVNDLPTAETASLTVAEDSKNEIVDTSPYTHDVDGDTLTVTNATANHGEVSVNPDGTLSYSPKENYAGSDQISYTVVDGNGGSVVGIINVLVTGETDAPNANNDEAQTDEDQKIDVIDVLANDSDPDNDTLTVTQAESDHGVVTINANGTLSYQPNDNFFGKDTIRYTINDGELSDSAVVVVTVNAVNDDPTTTEKIIEVDEDSKNNVVDLTQHISDVDEDPAKAVSATALHGSVEVKSDGSLRYTPNLNYYGDDTITYQVEDGKGGTAEGVVKVTVKPLDDAPITRSDYLSINEDESVTGFDALKNDEDPDGQSISLVSATTAKGKVTVNGNLINYKPDADFNGEVGIEYTITDGENQSTGYITIDVMPVNDAPTMQPVSVAVDENSKNNAINILDKIEDKDGGNAKPVSVSTDDGIVSVDGNGIIYFTPTKDFVGTAKIDVTVSDGNGGSVTGSITVVVNSVNQPPLAVDDGIQAFQDTPLYNVDVLWNDSDLNGDDLTLISAVANHGTVVIDSNQNLTYTPDVGFHGQDWITYTIKDPEGLTDSALVDVRVKQNNAPSANNDVATIDQDTSLTRFNVLANDSDQDSDALSVTNAVANVGVAQVNSDKTITFTPPANWVGKARITYTVSDGKTNGTAQAVLEVTVLSTNQAPVANPDSASVTQGERLSSINVLGNDNDPDGDTLTVTSVSASHGSATINSNGTVRYQAPENYEGLVVVTYGISDGKGGTASSQVNINVTKALAQCITESGNGLTFAPGTSIAFAHKRSADYQQAYKVLSNGTAISNWQYPENTSSWVERATLTGGNTFSITYKFKEHNRTWKYGSCNTVLGSNNTGYINCDDTGGDGDYNDTQLRFRITNANGVCK